MHQLQLEASHDPPIHQIGAFYSNTADSPLECTHDRGANTVVAVPLRQLSRDHARLGTCTTDLQLHETAANSPSLVRQFMVACVATYSVVGQHLSFCCSENKLDYLTIAISRD